MRRALLAVLACGISSGTLLANQGGTPAVEWYEDDGRAISGMGAASRTKPAETDLTPRQMVTMPKPAKTSDGRLATRVGINAWFDGKRVHVTTVLVIPKDPDAELPRGVNPPPGFFTYSPLASFTLAVGESRRVDEMKKFGWTPVTIRVHPPGFKH